MKKFLSWENYDPNDEMPDSDLLRKQLKLMNLAAVGREVKIHREVLSRFVRGDTKRMSDFSVIKLQKLFMETYCPNCVIGLMSVSDFSKATGMSIEYIEKNIESIGVPYYKISGRIIFSESEVYHWMIEKEIEDETIG